MTVLEILIADGTDSSAAQMLGELDSAFLFSYAAAMFLSGFIADRVNLRYFLSLGMLLSGAFCYLFGLGKTYNIHNFSYYVIVQVDKQFMSKNIFTSFCIISKCGIIVFLGFSGYFPDDRLAWCGFRDEQLVRKGKEGVDFRHLELPHQHRKHFR